RCGVGPWGSSWCRVRWSAWGRRGAVADDARTREVGPRHSSWEAGEQSGAIRRGVGGAKGGGQGECGPAKHVPDAEPGKRVTGAGTHTASIGRHTPEVGAVCGKAARTVLCGGRAMKRTSLPLRNCDFMAAKSLIDLATSRLALRDPALRAATALTRPNQSAQRRSRGRHAVPTTMTVGPKHVIANDRVERGDHLAHHCHDRDFRFLSGSVESIME